MSLRKANIIMNSTQGSDPSTNSKPTTPNPDENPHSNPEANFSTLILSIASSAAMSLGLAPNPTTQKMEKNLEIARFNIDLLVVLQNKTKNNLDPEENRFLESVVRDLQLKYIQNQ